MGTGQRDAGPIDLKRRLEQLCDAVVQAGVELTGERVVSLSVGAAFYPADGENAQGLVSQADSRMYEMKRAGSQLPEMLFVLPELHETRLS